MATLLSGSKQTFCLSAMTKKRSPQLKKLKPRAALEDVVQAVSEQFDSSQAHILAKGRKRDKARQVAIYLVRDMSGLSCRDLGLYFRSASGR